VTPAGATTAAGTDRPWLVNIIVGRSLAVAVELLKETHHDGGTHDKGCDFHDSSPAVAPVWRGANHGGEMLQPAAMLLTGR
jgi:hypothetical protein